jgi:hypothetical protein
MTELPLSLVLFIFRFANIKYHHGDIAFQLNGDRYKELERIKTRKSIYFMRGNYIPSPLDNGYWRRIRVIDFEHF